MPDDKNENPGTLWKSVEEISAAVQKLPEWKRGGSAAHEAGDTTPREVQPPDRAERVKPPHD